MKKFLPFRMKEWLDCCMDVCSSYRIRRWHWIERLSYQSKIISINIRISPLLSRGRWNMPEFLKSPYNCLSKVYRFIWSCRFVFLVLNLIFPPSRFSLPSSGRSLCYLLYLLLQQLQEKKRQPKIFFRAQCETLKGLIEDYAGLVLK